MLEEECSVVIAAFKWPEEAVVVQGSAGRAETLHMYMYCRQGEARQDATLEQGDMTPRDDAMRYDTHWGYCMFKAAAFE